jgi:AraC-like DNA-binding protein
VDPLADLLAGAHASSGLFNRTILQPPWSLRVADEAPLALATAVRGVAWVVPDDDEPILMDTGDIAIFKGPEPYTVADPADTEPQMLIGPDGHCQTLTGRDLRDERYLGVRTNGADPDGTTVLISGTYPITGDVSARLLHALPSVLVVPARDIPASIRELLVAEVSRDDPGQQVVLDRLLDLALLTTLRVWFARPEAEAPGWYQAQADAVVGVALRAIHEDPRAPWTVESLAAAAGVSRAALARRFNALVGEPPMTYLTSWRIALAADLLRDTDDTIESIARQTGYSNAFALSVAFKRLRGLSPTAFRHAG